MIILNFLVKHWLDVVFGFIIYFILVIRVWPPFVANFSNQYWDANERKKKKQSKVSLLTAIPNAIGYGLISPLLIMIPFRGMVTLILLGVIGIDLFYNRHLTNNDVTVAIVGLVALYLDKAIESADEISIWKIVVWKAKRTTANPSSIPPAIKNLNESRSRK